MNIKAVCPYIRSLRPRVSSWIQQTCSLRNTLKIGKNQYELAIDVKHFCKDELRVKARQDRILIEGKHERKLDEGVIIREFTRKYRLPPGVDPKKIQSELTNDGILTIKAPRDVTYDANNELLCETQVPIMIKGKTVAEAKVSDDGIKQSLDSQAKGPDDGIKKSLGSPNEKVK